VKEEVTCVRQRQPASRMPQCVSIAYPREAILTVEQLASWLQIGVRSAERLDFPCVYLGTRTGRYIVGSVLDHLAKMSA